MKKIIRQWGKSLVISFDEEDQEIFNLMKGDVINIKEMAVERCEKDFIDLTEGGNDGKKNKSTIN